MALLKTILETLDNRKTYILSFAGSCVVFAFSMGWISKDVAESVTAVLGFLTAAALRHGVQKAGDLRP